jgi:hypothetical protein
MIRSNRTIFAACFVALVSGLYSPALAQDRPKVLIDWPMPISSPSNLGANSVKGIPDCRADVLLWPPCRPSVYESDVSLRSSDTGKSIGVIRAVVSQLVEQAGFKTKDEFLLESGGFAVRTPLEQYGSDGLSFPLPDRFNDGTDIVNTRGVGNAIIRRFANRIRARQFLFVFSNVEFEFKAISSPLNGRSAILAPRPTFPREILKQVLTHDFKISVFVYEYEKKYLRGAWDVEWTFSTTAELSVRQHLLGAGLPVEFFLPREPQ